MIARFKLFTAAALGLALVTGALTEASARTTSPQRARVHAASTHKLHGPAVAHAARTGKVHVGKVHVTHRAARHVAKAHAQLTITKHANHSAKRQHLAQRAGKSSVVR